MTWLKPLQARPTDGKPLARFKGDDVDRILVELVSEIEALLNQPQPKPSSGTETQTSTSDTLTGECPYLGLEAFTEDKEHLFFGRGDFADALFAKVKRDNFVALVGPSGSGKSSVVQAGLFPRLRRDAQPWATILFPPREDPFLSLAAGFVWHWQPQANYIVNTNEAKKLATELKETQRLTEAINRTVAAPDGRLLLVVDQFEELFTLCAERDRREFLDLLLATKGHAPVTFLLTLRADFMGQAQSLSPDFSQLLDDGIISHRPHTRGDLEAVITGPARYAGLEFEPNLVNLILQEVVVQPDSLPLLEYALKEMWNKRQNSVFGHTLYEAVGKVEGAISRHADAVLHALPETEQPLALRALTRLVRVAGDEGEADTRLRLPLGELSEYERAMLQTFVNARLLVTKREEDTGIETIEVAHEALIRRWEKLRETLDSDREFLMWRRRLDSRRKAWEQKGRDNNWLLYGGERNDAERWLNERGPELITAEIEFITWDDRPDFQIERILSLSSSLLLFSDEVIRERWFATLVFCREKERALSIAREIEDASVRAQAWRSIAEALAKAGMATEAREAATEALPTAREIKDASARVQAWRSIAEALAKAGMVTEALAAARKIEDASARAQALSSIAEALAKAGMVTEALAAAREIEDMSARVQAWRSIAEALVKAGMATEALAAAREIEDVSARAEALSSIAEALAKAGMATEAREAATEALPTAREIEDASARVQAWRSIAEALVKAGMVTEALAAAREIEDMSARAEAWRSIAEALVKAGMVTEALTAAREIESASARANALMAVVDLWFEQRQVEKAGKLLEEMQNAVSKIFEDSSRSEALRHLAVILARLHSYRAARETAEQCSSSEDQLAAYTAIFREYHIERNPSLAPLFAEQVKEENDLG